MSGAFSLARAGRWLLGSGIQEGCGGVARYYRSEAGRNKPISTEITGYIASALVYLFQVTGEEEYLGRARKTARFLVEKAWDPVLQTFPFEYPSPSSESRHQAYFFDCGIIVRGLLAVWRETGDQELLDTAKAAGTGMIDDFEQSGEYHAILDLPEKEPAPRTKKWSRAPGCYQLKAALAWRELACATGDKAFDDACVCMLSGTKSRHLAFLPGTADDRYEIMDRLHAYCYFLEGLTPFLDRTDCARAYQAGLSSVSNYLREIAPSFARADVFAQLLRARIYGSEAVGMDADAAQQEAEALTGFQAMSEDTRLDGGFFFGRRDGGISPHVNPVSTAFALQALEMWRGYRSGSKPPCVNALI